MDQIKEKPIDTIFDLLYTIHQNIQKLENYLLSENNLSSSEYRLIFLCPADFTHSCKEISKKAGLSVSRTSRILDKMVKKNLIIRKCDQRDRRKCEIHLTKKGQKIKSKIIKQREKLTESLAANYKEQELGRLIVNLQKITDISASFSWNSL